MSLDGPVSVNEGADSQSVQPDVTVRLSTASSSPVTVHWRTSNGSATDTGYDMVVETGQLTFQPGQTMAILNPTVFGDSIYEADETFTIELYDAVNAQISSSNHTSIITILNDDAMPQIDIHFLGGAESEGTAQITVKLGDVAGIDTAFSYRTSDNTALDGTHYNGISGTAIILQGQDSINIPVQLIDDQSDNPNRDFTFEIYNPDHAVLGDASRSFEILDDDGILLVSVPQISEGDGTVTFDVTLQGPVADQSVDVSYEAVDGSATSSEDYSLTSGVLNFTSSATPPFTQSETLQVTATINDDMISEGAETFELRLFNVQTSGNVLLPSTNAVATIADNEGLPSLSFDSASSTDFENIDNVVISYSLNAASSSDVTADIMVSGSASSNDYTSVPSQLLIPSGQTSGTIQISGIINDQISENDETVILTLSNISSNATLLNDTHIYTIADNDGSATLSFDSSVSSGAEGASSASIGLSLSPVSSVDVTAQITVSGTASASDDFAQVTSAITIPAGQTSGSVAISGIQDDNLIEGDETIILTLSSISNHAALGRSSHTYTITDNDRPIILGELSFAASASSVVEDAGSHAIPVMLSVPSQTDIDVSYTVTGTASPSDDYLLSDGILTIPAGQNMANINISAIIDE